MVDKGYELNILGHNKPEVKLLEDITKDKVAGLAPFNEYKKPDFFMPVNMLHGIISAEEWQKHGIGK
jgi:hypothetical protein